MNMISFVNNNVNNLVRCQIKFVEEIHLYNFMGDQAREVIWRVDLHTPDGEILMLENYQHRFETWPTRMRPRTRTDEWEVNSRYIWLMPDNLLDLKSDPTNYWEILPIDIAEQISNIK